MPRVLRVLFVVLLVGCMAGCGSEPRTKANRSDAPSPERLFTPMPVAHTNVDFTNAIEYTKETNVFTYRNYHNGGGVAIGDLNGDGLQDLYFTANQDPNRLYLNRGDWWFEDVTDASGAGGTRAWATGVSLADVNADGRLDIYVSNSGDISGDDKQNELFINQGNDENGVPQFEEQAATYGLDDEGYSTHAAFFDYDKDGDLDLYLLNNSFTPVSKFDQRNNQREVRNEKGGDKLFRNDSTPDAPQFTDVTAEAGLYSSEIGFGLGVTVGDVNRDGWQDIYVSNDFFERDYLYLNNQDGTFREVLTEQMGHSSLSSMGADMADVTNDGRPEIFVTDMLPETDVRLKTTSRFKTWNTYQRMVRNGYGHQLMRNTLQRNNGDGTFSDVSQIAGVHATDWSWGALMADFDLDGHKDIFVSNGVYKDVTDQDFINYLANEETAKRMMERGPVEFLNLIDQMPSQRLSNSTFQNQGDGTFRKVSEAWGLDTPSFSNGSAYGDLDNDGDLDLVLNNLGHESFLYRNNATERTNHRAVQVELEGPPKNPLGLGAQVTIEDAGRTIYLEQMPMRGFQSTVGSVLTAGVGAVDTVETVTVAWPDGRVQQLSNVPTGERLTVRHADAGPAAASDRPAPALPDPSSRRFEEVTDAVDLPLTHEENRFVDFDTETLIPKKISIDGPLLAVGDVNGDGRDDLFAGGAKGHPGQLLVQRAGGRFVPTNTDLLEQNAISEDLGAAFFDADGDGDLDLYVVSGGNEFAPSAPPLEDRLYLNDGRGRLTKTRGRIPDLDQSGSVVVPADVDGDGDLDLFVGGRVVPVRYGIPPESVVLENDGTGTFTDATDDLAPGLDDLGMVTDAHWTDVDGDGQNDFVVVGEWMPITIFRGTGAGLEPMNASGLDTTHGWWNRLTVADFDADGDPDFVVGNLGENVRLTASPDEPTRMYVGDFDRNGDPEPILTVYRQGEEVPFVLRGPLLKQLPPLRRAFPDHKSYAGTPIDSVFSPQQLEQALPYRADTFASVYVENRGNGTFAVRPLPYESQLSAMYALHATDVNDDGHLDVLMAGNFYGFPPNIGRLDATYGTVLYGDGTGHFTAALPRDTGFFVPDQARDIAVLNTPRGRLFVVSKNDAPAQAFRLQ